MVDVNCNACEEIRNTSPEFIVNGLTDDICTSLANDTGLSTSDENDSCTDLNNLNDCLIGNMATEVEAYNVCDWKEFARNFIPNLWVTIKAILCSLCGAWKKIHCIWDSLSKLTTLLANTTGGVAFVRYYRDLGTGDDVPYWNNITDGFHRTLDIYMDSVGASSGSAVADRDYVVMISNCTNFRYFNTMKGRVTFYSSGDTRDIEVIREHQAQHPDFAQQATDNHSMVNFSWTTSGAVLLKKGEHIKVDFYVSSASKGVSQASEAPSARLHQFVLTWIPINVSEALDPDDILKC